MFTYNYLSAAKNIDHRRINKTSEKKGKNSRECLSLYANDEDELNKAVRSMLKYEISNYLDKTHSSCVPEDAKIFLDNTEWRLIFNSGKTNRATIFDVNWFKYSRRDMNDSSKFLGSHKDHYDLKKVLEVDFPTPILKVIAKNIISDLSKQETFSNSELKEEYMKSIFETIKQNNFEGIIRILVNKFSEHGNEVLSATDIEAVNNIKDGQVPLFDFLTLKGIDNPHREICSLLIKPNNIYHIEQTLLIHYKGFASSMKKNNDRFQFSEVKSRIPNSLIAIIQVYARILHKFNSIMRDVDIEQKNDNQYQKVSSVNRQKISKLLRMTFLKKLQKVMIFQLIKCMQKKREL
jgi:hypothetical protein